MRTTIIAERPFEYWAELAKSDAEGFESQRRELIEEFLEGVPDTHRERLRCMQWRIDQERHLAGTPMAACLRISRMMWKQVLGDGGLRQRLQELDAELQGCRSGNAPAAERQRPVSANVLAFARD